MIRKTIALSLSVCILLLCFSCFTVAAQPSHIMPTAAPSVSAKSAVLIDAESRSVLFEKNANTRMGMASTTKIMTALIAVEVCDLQKVVTVSPQAVGVEGSSIYLQAGEKLTMEQLLYGLMLSSANDAATAIAIEIAGSVEAFAEKMNERAEAMGLRDTHFTNPHGLDNEAHYTTARELAEITACALQNPAFRTIVSTLKKTIPLNGTEGARVLVNHNKMLRLYDGAIGVKTGFTKKTGRSLVSAAERDGLCLIAVTINAPDDWNDHTKMLDYGFSSYEKYTVADIGSYTYAMPVTGGTESAVVLTNDAPLSFLLPKGHGEPVCRVELGQHFAFAPVTKGSVMGKVVCTYGDVSVEARLIAAGDIPSYIPKKKNIWEKLAVFFGFTE